MKKAFIVIGFVVLAIALIALAMLGIKSGSDNTGLTKKPNEKTTTKYDKIVEESGEFTVSVVNAYEYTDYEDCDVPAKGYTYYCIEIVAENITPNPKAIYRSEFICRVDGVETKQKLFNEGDFVWGDVPAGEKTAGKLYFEVPKEAKNIVIEYKNNFFEEESGIFFEVNQ